MNWKDVEKEYLYLSEGAAFDYVIYARDKNIKSKIKSDYLDFLKTKLKEAMESVIPEINSEFCYETTNHELKNNIDKFFESED